MTNSINHTNKGGRTRHTFWTWLIAALLAIYLFWHWQHGHGLSHASACCTGTSAAPAVASTAFSFTASNAHGYNTTGDTSNACWTAQSAGLTTWLKDGVDWVVAGDATRATLTGTVDSEEARVTKATELQAFCPEVAIDNQLMVQTANSTPVATMPPATKLYFGTGKTAPADDAKQMLAATIAWLKANSAAKAVISGYHDPRGDQDKNDALAKNRAEAVYEILKAAGIDETRIEMRKPQSTEGSGDLAEARRVEVSIE